MIFSDIEVHKYSVQIGIMLLCTVIAYMLHGKNKFFSLLVITQNTHCLRRHGTEVWVLNSYDLFNISFLQSYGQT